MKGMFLNIVLGGLLGRFYSIRLFWLFVPLVAAEIIYYRVIYDLSAAGCLRRGLVLIVAAEFAFLLGALFRPFNETTRRSRGRSA
ncbi:hypothetical protein CRT23_26890 [Methylobacterium sp. V23]|nr:hypothetical protein CRT23_26890 [Methylobacterium sp. V23]